jgi:putative transposase
VRKKRISVEQFTTVLKQAEAGASVDDLCRQVEISEQTFYRWKNRTGHVAERSVRAETASQENTRLKRVVTDMTLDKVMLQGVVQKSSEACHAARSRVLPDGQIRGQRGRPLQAARF